MRKATGTKLSGKAKRTSKSAVSGVKRKSRSTKEASKISFGTVGKTAGKVINTVAKAIKKGGLKSLTGRSTAKKGSARRPAAQAH